MNSVPYMPHTARLLQIAVSGSMECREDTLDAERQSRITLSQGFSKVMWFHRSSSFFVLCETLCCSLENAFCWRKIQLWLLEIESASQLFHARCQPPCTAPYERLCSLTESCVSNRYDSWETCKRFTVCIASKRTLSCAS